MRYEILDDMGNIVNTIIAEKEFVDKHYSGQYRETVEPPIGPRFLITKLAMMLRFTDAEYAGIISASKSDPFVQAWYDLFSAMQIIDLKNQRLIDGMKLLVDKNLIAQDRATVILTTPASPAEEA